MAICRYEVKTLAYEELKRIVKLPKFQRSVVWSTDMRKEFMETIRKGYPFGSILLYEINDKDFKYQLIDGLQRLSTIMHYENNQNDYIVLKECASEEFQEIFEIIELKTKMAIKDSMREQIISIISETFKKIDATKSIEAKVIENLKEVFPVISDLNVALPIMDVIKKIDNKVHKEIDLATLTLPVVIFRGEQSELPTIFDQINSTGTKLSKYEIFAALWTNQTYKIEDEEILKWVDNKYETMIEKSGITITEYYPGYIIENKEINLFEFAYAVGKIVRNKCKEMFVENNSDISQIDSIGFALIVVALGGSIKQMDKLPDLIEGAGPEDLVNLKQRIIECCEIVNKCLKNYIVSIDGKIYTKYLESQIVSIVGTLFKIKFEITKDLKILNKEGSAHHIKQFRKNMPKHYLYDIIRGYWAGSGDTKVHDLLATPIEENRYTTSIADGSWETVLKEWMSDQETKESKNVNILQKLFLNYMNKLSPISTVAFENYEFDIEHIVPLNRLFKKFNIGPFSAIGNLCFLPSFENRSKKDKTLYEQIDEKTIVFNLNDEILNKFFYAEKSELDFIKGEKFTKDAYLLFLKNRHNFLLSHFIDMISKL